MKYDILIVAAKKDLYKIKDIHESIVKFMTPLPNKIYCICSDIPLDKVNGIEYILETSVLDIEVSKIPVRSTWVYQQYLKLLQNVTIDKYLVIDADIIFNKPIEIFTEDKPNFFISNKTHNRPFFRYLDRLFGIKKNNDFSFISEIMFFDRVLINELILTKFKDHNEFIEESNKVLKKDCFISEYELYGNYIFNNYKDLYEYAQIRILKYGFDMKSRDVKGFIEANKDKNYNILSIPTYF